MAFKPIPHLLLKNIPPSYTCVESIEQFRVGLHPFFKNLKSVCHIMLIAIAYCSHLARIVYELSINMILHTVFMFVSFKTGVTFCYDPIFHCSNGVLENVPTIYLSPGVPQYSIAHFLNQTLPQWYTYCRYGHKEMVYVCLSLG